MRRFVAGGLACLAIAVAGCGGDAPPAARDETSDPRPPAAGERGLSRRGTYDVRWEPLEGRVPWNEHFSIEVRLHRAATGEPVERAVLEVRCEMPAHGHGMNVVPVVRELGGGVYRADGLLLHMRGDWELGIDVVVDDVAETADFPLRLE